RLVSGRRRREALGAAILHGPRRRGSAGRSRGQGDRARRLSLRFPVFVRRERRQRKRVQAGGELVAQRLVDKALSSDTALAFESRRHDLDSEMGFASLAKTGMAAMP